MKPIGATAAAAAIPPVDVVPVDAPLASLKLAIISDSAPSRNGVGSFYVDLVKLLEPHVAHIELLCPRIDDGRWRAGMVLPLPGDKTQKLCLPNPFSMQRELNRLQPDVIVVATPGVYGLFGALLARRMGRPLVVGFHTSFEQITKLYWRDSATRRALVHRYFKSTHAYLFKKADRVLVNSHTMAEQARELGAPGISLIGTSVSPVFIHQPPIPHSGELKKALFAGRLAPEKNLDAIIEAARCLPDITFTIAGEGPERHKVDVACAQLPNIRAIGWVDRDQLRQQLDAHDALILPSLFESFGTIALEAMARERFAVVSEACGIVDWDECHRGCYRMGERTLAETLGTIASLSRSERLARARAARQVAERLHRSSLDDWRELMGRVRRGE